MYIQYTSEVVLQSSTISFSIGKRANNWEQNESSREKNWKYQVDGDEEVDEHEEKKQDEKNGREEKKPGKQPMIICVVGLLMDQHGMDCER